MFSSLECVDVPAPSGADFNTALRDMYKNNWGIRVNKKMLIVFLGNLGTFLCPTNNRVLQERINTVKLKTEATPPPAFLGDALTSLSAGSRVGVCHDASGPSVSLRRIYKLRGFSCHSLRNFGSPEFLQDTGNFDRRVNVHSSALASAWSTGLPKAVVYRRQRGGRSGHQPDREAPVSSLYALRLRGSILLKEWGVFLI